MIGDGGMPIPKGVEIVDLALCGGVPTFKQVMDAVLDETQIREICNSDRRIYTISKYYPYSRSRISCISNNDRKIQILEVNDESFKYWFHEP